MAALRGVFGFIVRFFVVWVVSALALLLTSWLLPGLNLNRVGDLLPLEVAAGAAFVLGLANLLIRPAILLLAMPLGFIALFIVGFFVNAITLRLTAFLLNPALEVNSWLAAIIGGVLLSLMTSVVMSVLNVDSEGDFYEGVIQRRLGRQRQELPPNPTRGLVLLEIDGLSYHHLRRALAQGYMPHVQKLIDERGYVLSRTDCGLPSQTSACQSGILFGDNHDIPAFRWYDKAQGKLYVSSKDAAEINGRYANGNGLLRGGASVNNMVNGDAMLSLLTASDLRGGTADQKRARARDVYTLLLNPNFFMRVIGTFIGEALLEVWQYLRDVAGGVQPRLNRLHGAYPFVRAVTTVFMREVSGFLTMMQIVRGEPAIYATWPGYDEVAHHSGPWSKHAFGTLRGYDRFIGALLETIETKAPRPYEFLLLSDHGQSFGATFLMRYGYTLKQFIQERMPTGTVVHETAGGDDGSLSVIAMAAELGNIEGENMGGMVGKAATRRMKRAAERAVVDRDGEAAPEAAADVTFCGSGNLAQIYFHAFPRRATVSELNAAFPDLVDAVIGHEGVGLVVATDDDGVPIVFGKDGARNLHSGEIAGDDPLAAYGDVDVRAWQLRRVADFPSAGDLIAISTLYPDGTVAAMEELIGNHGGLGGEQTDSFLLHPADMVVPPTRCATDLFALLNARRDLPAPPPVEVEAPADDWSLANLLAGLRRVGDWLRLALRAATLDRAAYRVIAADRTMTGPALLISLVGLLISYSFDSAHTSVAGFTLFFLGRYGVWLLGVAILQAAGHILRGRATFAQTFRVLGFTQAIALIHLLRLIPILETPALIAANVLGAFAVWLGAAAAHQLRGWRTLLLPLAFYLTIVLGLLAILSLLGGFGFALDTLMQRFRVTP
ncbi:phage holin family protein [Promineifilum sp.]|uniref:phage holin family protein n=1 Tax=Promineifilum sp. TaxID=2664178 RepID=UPI0035AEECC5